MPRIDTDLQTQQCQMQSEWLDSITVTQNWPIVYNLKMVTIVKDIKFLSTTRTPISSWRLRKTHARPKSFKKTDDTYLQ